MRKIMLLLSVVASANATAETPPPAYQIAALPQGVPPAVLYAVAKVESNFKIRIGYYPWPWTLNIKGKGSYFATRAEACGAVMEGLRQYGKYGVDIGLTQQNWGWIGSQHYVHPCDALSPSDNLATAAIELRKCFDKEGDWVRAAGCYHRPAGGEPARVYREIFSQKYRQVIGLN
ncbi:MULTISPECIES: Soluble lytic murein transglycosylase [unclassified Pseudomonas]|uniref:Soluble lytic murein transglycosylase n=3 Tax=Pseudomonas TaxID=286 RepID=UPI002AB3D74F|nr:MULTISPECIES: Soluble lytic murein transglycosylase [unclassified Pseudomonas]MDY7563425.1 Soluble lytic murein transglycosylase [Pseudomonas sp. AB6]MEA9996495.1 Soluble lytic murein transglycosylase [Pseudomonas sp. AA4]MEB0213490.1 Soluble lytic murein transglycosylase [Pseudomonas sp. AB6]MEB0222236.1 Soluble lytic murein transglycosylase [Pseudomonas sp. AB12(2023)]